MLNDVRRTVKKILKYRRHLEIFLSLWPVPFTWTAACHWMQCGESITEWWSHTLVYGWLQYCLHSGRVGCLILQFIIGQNLAILIILHTRLLFHCTGWIVAPPFNSIINVNLWRDRIMVKVWLLIFAMLLLHYTRTLNGHFLALLSLICSCKERIITVF